MVGHLRGILAKPASEVPRRMPVVGPVPSLGLGAGLRQSVALATILAWPIARALQQVVVARVTDIGRQVAALVEPAADDLIAPMTSLVGGTASRAIDIYAGIFAMAGKSVSADGRSIFKVTPASRRWAEDLHGFVWLRDLVASNTPLARLNARALIEDWFDLADARAHLPIAETGTVTATRLLILIECAPWLLSDATDHFRQRLLAQITQHVRTLRGYQGQRGVSGLGEIRVAVALLAAAIAVPAFRIFLARHRRQLDMVLKHQILVDGGHVSRNPAAIVQCLALLIPLRDALGHIGQPASTTLMNAIDRMLPMLRFFVGPGHRLGHFNGAAPVSGRLLDAVLGRTETQGCAHGNAAHSGYQRIATPGTILIMDCGAPPPVAFACDAHAGCLAFEFSSPSNRIVINCGTPPEGRTAWRKLARETAAHSTVTVADQASATFLASRPLTRLIGPVVLPGPTQVDVDRREHGGTIAVVAGHDGYAQRFNLIHERTIRVSETGDQIDGRDRLMPAGDPDGIERSYVARFHLAPEIAPVMMTNGVIMLMAPDGEAWEFHCIDCPATIEESIDFSGADAPIATQQIVLSGKVPLLSELRWTFMRSRAGINAPTSAAVRH
jgi:uncharacterized heparinase superfamily protein